MQHMYGNDNLLSQRDNELYSQSSHIHQHLIHPHFQYQPENQSFSPQQSSTSDVDEASSSLNRANTTVTNKTIKKKKQTKKKRKDPNEPQKPVSPYALFFRHTQNEIKKKLTNPSFGEISKVVAHMWENIEPELKEQYKRKSAVAKKEYLKQLAAYRAVQISHQTPNMHHHLNQTSQPFNSHSIQPQQKHYHTGSMVTNNHHHHQQFCPQQYYHYATPYPQDNSHVYHSKPPHQTYSTYDSNNNYSDYQQYGSLRSTTESEHYPSYHPQSTIDPEHAKSTEDLNTKPTHYIDLTPMTNRHIEKHYNYVNNIHHGFNTKKEDDHSVVLPSSNEDNFHWNQTQW